MNLEQLAVLGIVVFAFMALTTAYNAARTIKRMSKRSDLGRFRRLVGSPDSAESVAMSVVGEVAKKHPEEVQTARELEVLTSVLEKALEEAETYYLNRVESRYRVLFSRAVDRIIFERNLDKPKEREEE